MRFLLMPEDERLLVYELTSHHGLGLLLDDRIGPEGPAMARNPMAALPERLPGPPEPGSPDVRTLTFWRADLGPVVTLGDPGGAEDAVSRVTRAMAQDASADWQRLVDHERTQVIVWRRCGWMGDGRLHPGNLHGMATPRSNWSSEARRIVTDATRWMKRNGREIDLFDFAGEVPSRPERRWAGYALPGASAWLDAGGQVWPWDA